MVGIIKIILEYSYHIFPEKLSFNPIPKYKYRRRLLESLDNRRQAVCHGQICWGGEGMGIGQWGWGRVVRGRGWRGCKVVKWISQDWPIGVILL